MSWLRRLFCRHREQGEAVLIGTHYYAPCLTCHYLIPIDQFFGEEP